MITFKKFLESTDPLKDVEIDMFFRKVFDMPKQEAVDARDWYTGEMDWFDMNTDARDYIITYIERHYESLEDMNGSQIADRCEAIVSQLMHNHGVSL